VRGDDNPPIYFWLPKPERQIAKIVKETDDPEEEKNRDPEGNLVPLEEQL